jgi:hypothetical protein
MTLAQQVMKRLVEGLELLRDLFTFDPVAPLDPLIDRQADYLARNQ